MRKFMGVLENGMRVFADTRMIDNQEHIFIDYETEDGICFAHDDYPIEKIKRINGYIETLTQMTVNGVRFRY